jgi:hypothetical protein
MMPTGSPDPADLVERLRTIDAADSIAGSLTAIVEAASVGGIRAALYIANGTRLEQWPVSERTSVGPSFHDINEPGESITLGAFRQRQPIGNDESCAIPVLLDGSAVAVLYGEIDPEADGIAGWAGSVETVARHGAARVGYLTALRTAQARQWLADSGEHARTSTATTSQPEDMTASARRYARLLVSEIKLYNESAVMEGRSRRDLLVRLGPEIDRARRLFEQRVPASVAGRADYFQQELIQTLAGGDPSLLG